jgi:hypothetical protein
VIVVKVPAKFTIDPITGWWETEPFSIPSPTAKRGYTEWVLDDNESGGWTFTIFYLPNDWRDSVKELDARDSRLASQRGRYR